MFSIISTIAASGSNTDWKKVRNHPFRKFSLTIPSTQGRTPLKETTLVNCNPTLDTFCTEYQLPNLFSLFILVNTWLTCFHMGLTKDKFA
jgi:hypothetical protein